MGEKHIDGRVNNGGPREGAGRKLQPSTKAIRKMRKYIDFCYIKDFQLMARMANNPEKHFGDKIQFAGKEEEALSSDGKQSQSRTGQYQLDPLFKTQIELLKWRCSKFLPDAPKEVQELAKELQEELSLRTINLTQNVQIVNNPQPPLPSKDVNPVLDIQQPTALPTPDPKTLPTQQDSLSYSVIVK